MSIRRGNKIIASRITNGFSLFDCKWSDHILNNISWLRADTFSWQSGDVYKAAYEHLLEDFENRVGKGTDTDGWLSETIDGVTVYYIVAPDGHKICVSDNETNVEELYENTGIAWYYILDKANKRFKLPRTKWGFTGLRNGVGESIEAGLPNISGYFMAYTYGAGGGSGAVISKINNPNAISAGTTSSYNFNEFTINASRSSSVYGNSDTVQPPATEMYLYFYVGNYVEDITTIDAGKLAEAVNDFDIDTFKSEVDEVRNEAISDINQTTSDSVTQLKNMGEVVNYTNITNCITEIPQDIKLELSDGDLVLKAGSKLYVPNGFESDGVTLKFDVKNINSDLIRETEVEGQKMSLALYKNSDGGFLQMYELPYTSLCSGPTDSLSGVSYHVWYDTTNNIIKYYGTDGTTNNYHAAFPLGFVTVSGTSGVSSIDQVFNGFGYIGSAVFALPGVKALIPNGRNADGSLNNIPAVVENPLIQHVTTTDLDVWHVLRLDNGKIILRSTGHNTGGYNPDTNYNVFNNKNNISCIVTNEYFNSSGIITSFSSKPVLHAVDYSDFKEVKDHTVIKFQAPTSANNYTWYRKYADGWVEQGVIDVQIATAIYTFNFPILMANTKYTVITSINDELNTTAMTAKYSSKATTGVNVRCTYQASSIRGDIMVCGMAAQ